MQCNLSGPCILLLAAIAACKPAKPGDETGTSTADTTAGETAGSTVASTTEGAGPCGADGVQFKEICFRRYDLADVAAHYIVAADCDGDDRPDIVVDNGATREMRILYWNGPDDFELSAATKRSGGGGGDIQVFVDDFDGDADKDVGILRNTFEVVPLEGGQPGAAQIVPFSDMNFGFGAAFDVDADARADMFIDTFSGVQLWRRMGEAYAAEGPTYPVPDCGYVASITSADFNEDGIADVAFIGDDSCGIKDLALLPPSKGLVMLGRADLTFEISDEIWAGTESDRAHTGDFNADGDLDLAIINYGSDDISVLLGRGDGTFAPDVRHKPGMRLAHIGVGDLNGDGFDEIVSEGGHQAVVASEPYQITEVVPLLTGVYGPVAIADLNQDGFDDMAMRADDGSNHLILLISEAP